MCVSTEHDVRPILGPVSVTHIKNNDILSHVFQDPSGFFENPFGILSNDWLRIHAKNWHNCARNWHNCARNWHNRAGKDTIVRCLHVEFLRTFQVY